VGQPPLQHQDQLLDLERLGEKIVGPGADGGDGRLQAAEGGDQDHRDVGPVGGDLLAQGGARGAGHVLVHHQDVDVLGPEHGQGGVRRPGGEHSEATPIELRRKQLTHRSVVIDDQHPSFQASSMVRPT
jgi:hypothetical protein